MNLLAFLELLHIYLAKMLQIIIFGTLQLLSSFQTFGLMDESGYIWSTYYISLIVIGSFFMLNLVLGVLSG